MTGIHRQGGEHREKVIFKIVGQVAPLGLVDLAIVEEIDAVLSHARSKGAMQKAVLLLHQGPQGAMDQR
jgi:hypothetical protein